MAHKLTKTERNIFSCSMLIPIVFGIFTLIHSNEYQDAAHVLMFGPLFAMGFVWVLHREQNKPATIKVGLDLHGVISAHPKFFSEMSKALVKNGAEVHVITGSHSVEILDELKKYNITYTHLFSIADYHRSIGTHMWYDANKTPWIDKKMWEMTKAEYCGREGIEFHIDDSDIYGEHFTTPYAKINVKGYARRIRHK